jgi:hypothetical protein
MKKLWWYPYAGNFNPMSAFSDMIHLRNLGERFAAAMKTMPMLLRRPK